MKTVSWIVSLENVSVQAFVCIYVRVCVDKWVVCVIRGLVVRV